MALVDVFFFNVDDIDVQTSSNINIDVDNVHSWSIITPYLDPNCPKIWPTITHGTVINRSSFSLFFVFLFSVSNFAKRQFVCVSLFFVFLCEPLWKLFNFFHFLSSPSFICVFFPFNFNLVPLISHFLGNLSRCSQVTPILKTNL